MNKLREEIPYRPTFIVKTGCFDLLHIGHIRMFERCKTMADYLIVFVGSDKVLAELYPNSEKAKAYFDENNRAEMVASIQCVDFVVIVQEPTHEQALSMIRPEYYHIPSDDKWPEDKREMCNKHGIKLVIDSNTELTNHGKKLEPHTTQIKNDKPSAPFA